MNQYAPIEAPEYPPSLVNVETEAALLGALMINNGIVDQVAERVAPTDFSFGLHQRIYSVILSEIAGGRSANPPLLRNHFLGDPELEQVGGPAYLMQLTGSQANVIGVWDFAKQVVDLAKRRRLIDEMAALSQDVQLITDNPVESLVDRIDNALASALQREEATKSVTIAQGFDQTLQAIEDEADGKGPQGIRIDGLDDFNFLTGDLRRGELMYLGGRPSMGKTALAVDIALGAARAGNGTLFVSLEMRMPEVVTRAMSSLVFEYGNSPSFDAVRRGKLNAFDRDRLKEAREQIANWPLVVTDPATLSIGRLAMMIRRYQRQMAARGQGLDLVIIDYLGLIRGSDKRAKRYEEVGEISRTLKVVAKQCNVALLVLAQLNRECEKREDKRPMLSDLRDAGDVEQDADTVMFVFREEYYLERSEPEVGDKKRDGWEKSIAAARDRVELITAKVRNGRVGKRLCYFFGSHQAVRGSNYMRDLGR